MCCYGVAISVTLRVRAGNDVILLLCLFGGYKGLAIALKRAMSIHEARYTVERLDGPQGQQVRVLEVQRSGLTTQRENKMTYQVPDWAGPFTEAELFQEHSDYEFNARYDYVSEAYGNTGDAYADGYEDEEVPFEAHVNAYKCKLLQASYEADMF